jgi:adenosylcobinamide-GDP ribazoletransferase
VGPLFAAFRFLTIFPLPGSIGTAEEELRRSLVFFPFVGFLLGLIAGGAAWLFWTLFPSPVASVLLILLLLFFSGGLHLDGLADTADGFFSARPREKMLVIMRDSRLGAMGVLALIALFFLKFACLFSLEPPQAIKAGLLMPLGGRFALVLMFNLLPYARSDGGLADTFYTGALRMPFLIATLLFLLVAVALFGYGGLVVVFSVIAVIAAFSFWCKAKIGGSTGDTLGAACELAEAVTVLALTALYPSMVVS